MTAGAMRDTSALWWLAPLVALLLFWLLNIVVPLNADDFACRVIYEYGEPKIITSFSQLTEKIKETFISHNARLGNIYYLFSLSLLPRWLSSLTITLWVGGLIFMILRIALRRRIQPSGFDMTLWIGIFSVIFLPLQAMENFISYTAGLYNYIPGGVGTLLVLDKVGHWFIEGKSDAPKWGLYLVSFLSGWSNEIYGFFIIPLLVLFIVWIFGVEKKPLASVPSWVWYLAGSFTVGFCVLIFAPGTQSRALLQPHGSFFTLLATAAFSYVSFGLLTAPFCVSVVFILLLFMNKEDIISLRERMYYALLLISTAGTIPCAALGGFMLFGRALWGVHLVLGIIMVWGISRFMYKKIWLMAFPVMAGFLFMFGVLIWNTSVVRTEFERIERSFVEAGKRGDNVLLVDFPELRSEPHSTIMRMINRVVLVQRDPKHWLNAGLIRYYSAVHAGKKDFKGPSYIVLDNLVPPYLNRYSYDTRNDPLNHYPEIQTLVERQKLRNPAEVNH